MVSGLWAFTDGKQVLHVNSSEGLKTKALLPSTKCHQATERNLLGWNCKTRIPCQSGDGPLAIGWAYCQAQVESEAGSYRNSLSEFISLTPGLASVILPKSIDKLHKLEWMNEWIKHLLSSWKKTFTLIVNLSWNHLFENATNDHRWQEPECQPSLSS